MEERTPPSVGTADIITWIRDQVCCHDQLKEVIFDSVLCEEVQSFTARTAVTGALLAFHIMLQSLWKQWVCTENIKGHIWSSGEKIQEGKKPSWALEFGLYHVVQENKHIYNGKYWRWQTWNPIIESNLWSRIALEMLCLAEFIRLNNASGELTEQ